MSYCIERLVKKLGPCFTIGLHNTFSEGVVGGFLLLGLFLCLPKVFNIAGQKREEIEDNEASQSNGPEEIVRQQQKRAKFYSRGAFPPPPPPS